VHAGVRVPRMRRLAAVGDPDLVHGADGGGDERARALDDVELDPHRRQGGKDVREHDDTVGAKGPAVLRCQKFRLGCVEMAGKGGMDSGKSFAAWRRWRWMVEGARVCCSMVRSWTSHAEGERLLKFGMAHV
jgi:hypothetical protein